MNTYEHPPYRPPNEASSALIRASRGCPWNKCLFCTMYKTIKYQPRPVDDIKNDIDHAVHLYPEARAVFIADSDSLTMKNIDDVLRYVRLRFPHAERITSYARAKTLMKLGATRLTTLKNAGLTRVHVGLESGDKDTLDFLKKGVTPEEIIAGGKAAKDAGLEVSLYILIGAGGKTRLTPHALQSANVCNAVRPDFIRLRTLIVQHGSRLEEHMNRGEYLPTSPIEKLQEVRTFLEHLNVQHCELASDHYTNYIWVNQTLLYSGISGMLPKEKPAMLNTLNKTLDALSTVDGEILDATILYQRGLIHSL